MKIEFKKIDSTEKDFEVSLDELKFQGIFKRSERNLIKIDGKIVGLLSVICDRCCEPYDKEIEESILLYAANGEYQAKSGENEDIDIIEFFDGFVDFDAILESEVESIKSDYYICKKCDY